MDIGAMTEHDAGGDDVNVLKARLSAAVSQPDIPLESVRELVCALVDKMKVDGAPPEKVIIAIKMSVLLDVTVRATLYSHQLTGREKLLDQALGWCIQRYYGAPS
jgi:hypothetical protein